MRQFISIDREEYKKLKDSYQLSLFSAQVE